MITSTANRQVKLLIQLKRKKKIRDGLGVFVAEGPKMLSEAPADRIEKVYFSESRYASHSDDVSAFEERQPTDFEVLQDNVFKAVCDTENPQGVLAIVRKCESTPEDLFEESSPLITVLENLQDPGNLGTILRTAEGAGVTGVILCGDCVDLYNPKTVRSTMGSIYRVPVCRIENADDAVRLLHGHGIRTFAALPGGKSYYDEADYRDGSAFLIGNESSGLSDTLTRAADELIRIPMEGRLESLNASVAASILMYEAYRQRRAVIH